MTATKTAEVTPHHSDTYEAGAILENQWGYEQTNIDYYVVVKRLDKPNGVTWLTLQAMTTGTKEETGFLSGHCTPGHVDEGATPFRRKLHKWSGEERGVAIESYGWCSLWDGKPSGWTGYA